MQPLDLNKKQEYSDGKYSVYTFSGDSGNFKRLACQQESICLLPFDLNEHGQIRNIYLSKYKDHLLGGTGLTCVTDTFDKNEYDSHYSAIEDCVKNELGISEVNVNSSFYLGKVRHGIPFSKEYRCYGINLSEYMPEPVGFTATGVKPNPRFDSIEKVKFNRILKGEIADSLVLSCSILLLSYFSE
jgi:hypothetical protein